MDRAEPAICRRGKTGHFFRRTETSEFDVVASSVRKLVWTFVPILPTEQLVAGQGGDELDGRLLLRLRLAETDLQGVGRAGEATYPGGMIQFDEIHVLSVDR